MYCADYNGRMTAAKTRIKTIKVRIKDKHAPMLRAHAREVNFVWNWANEVSYRALKPYSGRGKWLSAFDLTKMVAGAGKEGLRIGMATAQQVVTEYARKRKQFKRPILAWRKSEGSRRSLGWIPLRINSDARYRQGQLWYRDQPLSLWDHLGLSDYELRSGCFTEDARGRWYYCATIEVKVQAMPSGTGDVGIDLGVSSCATTSDGQVLDGHWMRELEDKLKTAQRAQKKGRARVIHAKIVNRRRDAQHKFTTAIVNENALVVVGGVSSSAMMKTTMAKGVYDAAWYQLKTMLEYKCENAGAIFMVVNEAYTTQTCSSCGVISDASPRGRAGLRIREWTCSSCGTTHDRDINAARNILAAGHCRLAEGSTRRRKQR